MTGFIIKGGIFAMPVSPERSRRVEANGGREPHAAHFAPAIPDDMFPRFNSP